MEQRASRRLQAAKHSRHCLLCGLWRHALEGLRQLRDEGPGGMESKLRFGCLHESLSCWLSRCWQELAKQAGGPRLVP